ncbi:TPA: hypothetical protein PXN07_003558 [Yersinia enterocolitica]|uniref:hypothetical protein n=1 Tax=Yersinia enterocolitica TaxID=630 RepID=UPI002A380F60|nr:hypothetical protein [Yersinia enterocolitica]HDL7338271.1 hypothetical protein [Yersinia enterocolitica]HDL7457207.1 hypothetical protein [Yersinia enterocolitica]HDL7738900.1 hypothetical protein [Yersinia enterocolitica]
MSVIGVGQSCRKLPFRDFTVEWRKKLNINRNEACRHFNGNPHNDESGQANREIILFRANRIAESKNISRPFKTSDSNRRFESFTENERELIIDALNFMIRLTRPYPDYFSLADRKIKD